MGARAGRRMICWALERLAAGTCHSRAVGVDDEFNESSTATSGQDAALCGHQTARQYSFQPPFQTVFGGLSLINSSFEEALELVPV